jgi:cytochrome P450
MKQIIRSTDLAVAPLRYLYGILVQRLPQAHSSLSMLSSYATLFRKASSSSPLVLHVLVPLSFLLLLLIMFCSWLKRARTYRALVACGLPTVLWHPKFVSYEVVTAENEQQPSSNSRHSSSNNKLPSSTITNILPRMRRLEGPWGMYGTVYGLSTAVVHVAHPVPALMILGATSTAAAVRGSGPKADGLVPLCPAGTAKAPAYNHFKNFCGEGVFTADGDDWKIKRAAVLHALMRGRAFHERLGAEIDQSCLDLFRTLDHHANGGTLNIVPVLQRATIGLIFRYITHCELSCLEEDQNGNILDKKNVAAKHPNSLLSSYLESITRIRMIILAQSRSIWFLLPRWMYITFASLYQTEEAAMGPIRRVAHRACALALPNSPIDLLQRHPLYVAANTAQPRYSKNLIDEAITLLFAGQDTSAATLSWTLHLLSLYPKVQSKLVEEVSNFFDNGSSATDCSAKKVLSKLPYLDAVIKESMRLYPVAPFVVRKVSRRLKIPAPADEAAPGISLPDGSLACIWIYSLHRHPDFWGRPNDFVPERWLEQTDKGIKTQGAYIPFAAGPRNCVGQPLANIILRQILAQLIHRYRFRDERVEQLQNTYGRSMIPKDQMYRLRKDMQAGFTVLPRGGLSLSVVRR